MSSILYFILNETRERHIGKNTFLWHWRIEGYGLFGRTSSGPVMKGGHCFLCDYMD